MLLSEKLSEVANMEFGTRTASARKPLSKETNCCDERLRGRPAGPISVAEAVESPLSRGWDEGSGPGDVGPIALESKAFGLLSIELRRRMSLCTSPTVSLPGCAVSTPFSGFSSVSSGTFFLASEDFQIGRKVMRRRISAL